MKDVPKAPRFTLAAIGPGLVLVAMGLGSGEFILWPYLIAQYGFGILWGAIVGMSIQYIVSNEAGRYTLATGGSVYAAFHKLYKLLPAWFILSTFASFAWPGIILSAGNILGYMTGGDSRVFTILLLLLIGSILTLGGTVYTSLERFQKISLMISVPIFIIIAVLVVNPMVIQNFANGLIGIGEGYTLLPSGISIMAFLGSVAYTGAAGNLVLSHSFYLQDEKLGMANHYDSAVKKSDQKKILIEGELFKVNAENIARFKKWLAYTFKEQFISFWFLGLATIFLLVIIAYGLLYPFEGNEGLSFIYTQATTLATQYGPALGFGFLVIGALFLFTTQLGVFETTSRIMTENVQLLSPSVSKSIPRSRIFFICLWIQIIAAGIISLLGLAQPVTLLLISTFFSAISMLVLTILVLRLNTSAQLPAEIRINLWRKIVLIFGIVFYLGFVGLTVIDLIT